jgi:hypothetical protein
MAEDRFTTPILLAVVQPHGRVSPLTGIWGLKSRGFCADPVFAGSSLLDAQVFASSTNAHSRRYDLPKLIVNTAQIQSAPLQPSSDAEEQ